MTDATVTIKGRSDLGLAVKQAEQQLKGLAKQGELIGKVFRGGAIAGAFFAFERLAESAQKAAQQIGNQGTAKSLSELNKQIDQLKAKGTNLIGTVLGNAYGAFFGSDVAKLREQVDFLRRMQGRSFVAAGYKDIGTGFFTAAEGAEKLLELEKKLALYESNQARGARSRAPGGQGGRGRNVFIPEELEKATGGSASASKGPSPALLAIEREFDLATIKFETLQKATEDAGVSLDDYFNQSLDRTAETIGQVIPKVQGMSDEMSVFADEAARNMQSAFSDFLFDPFADGLKGMAAGFIDTIRRMVAEAAAAEILKAFFTWGANTFSGGVGSFFSSMATARAGGGPVMAGMPYKVGERGSETFVPSTSGTIVPHGAMGGVALTYNIDARGADAERIAAIMPGLLQRTKAETVAEVRNLIARGRM